MDGLILSLERARVSRPDFAFRIEDLIVEGALVVVRTTISGTHLGDFFGLAPTGKWIEIPAIDLWQVADGKLASVWHFEDILGMMEQLGMIPGGAATAAAADLGAPQPPATGETSAMATPQTSWRMWPSRGGSMTTFSSRESGRRRRHPRPRVRLAQPRPARSGGSQRRLR